MSRDEYPGIWRYIIVFISMVEVLCFTGLIQGWGALVYVLKDEGFLAELCIKDERLLMSSPNLTVDQSISRQADKPEDECDERDARFNLYFTLISTIGMVPVLILGHTFTKYGTRITRFVFISIFGVGCICIALAGINYPWLICVGGILMIGSGYIYQISSTQFTKLFPDHSSTIVGLLNGMKVSSVFTQQLVKIAYDNGIGRRTSYFFVFGMVLLTFPTTAFLFPRNFLNETESNKKDPNHQSNDKDIKPYSKKSEKTSEHSPCKEGDNNGFKNRGYDWQSEEKLDQSNTKDNNVLEHQSQKDKYKTVEKTEENITLSQNICNYLYVLNVLWFTVINFRINYFYGTINPLLERVTRHDNRKVSYYTDILSYSMIGGIIACIVFGIMYDWQRRFFKHVADNKKRKLLSSVGPLIATCLLSIVLSSLVFVQKEYVIYALAVVFVMLRSLFSTVGNTFLVDMFPSSMYGTLYGLRSGIANIFSLVQYALFEWSLAYKEAELHVITFVLCMCSATFVHPMSFVIANRLANKYQVTYL